MMRGWCEHLGKAAHLPLENVDTDQIIPARFMSTPRAEGYARFLFHDLAQEPDGSPRADFPLTQSPDASILIAGRNFGCGSSREAAVYALVDAGIRAVIATSFGEIFAANAVNNGMLPARVSDADLATLAHRANETGCSVQVDISQKTISTDGLIVGFELDPVWRTKLMNGWDDIDLTQAETPRIAAHTSRLRKTSPWIWT